MPENEAASVSGLRILQRGTLKDGAVEAVRSALLAGDMVPGRIYSANSLAARLGVSNSPVREAMMELAGKGLLEVVRNRGFRVVEMTDADRQEVYNLRLMVEVPAVVEVARRGLAADDEPELRRLLKQVLATADSGDLRDYLDADQTLHMRIVALLGNRRLCGIVENLRDQSRVRGSYRLAERGMLAQSAQEHVPIVEALIAGDADAANSLMIEHLAYACP